MICLLFVHGMNWTPNILAAWSVCSAKGLFSTSGYDHKSTYKDMQTYSDRGPCTHCMLLLVWPSTVEVEVKGGGSLVYHLSHWQAKTHPGSTLVCSRSLHVH